MSGGEALKEMFSPKSSGKCKSRKCKSKPARRFHLTPISVAKTKNSGDRHVVERMCRKRATPPQLENL